MDDKYFAARRTDRTHKITYKIVAFDLVNSNAVFHGHWNAHSITHSFHAIGNSLRLVHQACAKGTALHAIARAAAIQIDFVIAILLA